MEEKLIITKGMYNYISPDDIGDMSKARLVTAEELYKEIKEVYGEVFSLEACQGILNIYATQSAWEIDSNAIVQEFKEMSVDEFKRTYDWHTSVFRLLSNAKVVVDKTVSKLLEHDVMRLAINNDGVTKLKAFISPTTKFLNGKMDSDESLKACEGNTEFDDYSYGPHK